MFIVQLRFFIHSLFLENSLMHNGSQETFYLTFPPILESIIRLLQTYKTVVC